MNRLKLPLLSLAVIGLSTLNILFGISESRPGFLPSPPPPRISPASGNPTVLGNSVSNAPTVFISSTRDGYNAGGVLSQSILDEPAIELQSYGDSGPAAIDIYQADMNQVLSYLIHDDQNNQTLAVDYSGLTKLNSLSTTIGTSEGSRILLPISGEGIWLLKVKFGDSENFAYLIRTSIAGVAKEGETQLLIWAQDLATKKTVTNVGMEIFSLNKEIKSVGKGKADQQGIMKIGYTPTSYDVAVITSDTHQALLPINLRYLNGGGRYESFTARKKNSRYFIFTDRPLYRPDDTVNFKAVVRDDNDARYSIPVGTAKVKAYKGWDSKAAFYEKDLPISNVGTVTGDFVIPSAQGTGDFQISIEIINSNTSYSLDSGSWGQSTVGFQVEYFRKPEYSIDIEADKQVVIAGDNIDASIVGSYFSGQPLTNREVKYTVYSSSYYEYEFLMENAQFFDASDYNYGYWGGNKILESSATLDSTGTAKITLPTAESQYRAPRSQVFSIEAEFTDETGNPVRSRKNFLVYPGEFSIFRHSSFYTGQVNRPYILPILVKSHTTSSIKDIHLTAKIIRESWIAQPLAPGQKYPNYIKETQEMPPLTAITDQLGKTQFTFTPTQTGSYHFIIEAKDRRGYLVSKDMYTWISSVDRPAPSSQYYQELKIEADRQNYEPNEKVNLKIWSDTADHDYLLSFERDRVHRYQVVRVSGQTSIVNLNLESTDVPNIYITVSGFNDSSFISDTTNISVSPESKRLKVVAAPEASRYGPGQTAVINLETKDANGKPVAADVAFWAVDKAIFELSDSNLGDIFDRFWSQRYNNTATAHSLENIVVNNAEMGGCFLPGTQILMADGSTKSIEEVKSGDYILTKSGASTRDLVKAKVTGTHQTKEDGYLTINTTLRVTPSHILFVNGTWKTAAEITLGDVLSDKSGTPVVVEQLEWQAGEFDVYNLTVDKYHTYIADGFWVHNDKGDGGNRSVFKDTAYWNPSIKTNAEGKARVAFKLPDNLTTWTLAAVASSLDTKVGQTTTEIVISKEVFVRPVLPNILRVGDNAKVSALIYNYTDAPQNFEAKLDFNAGKIVSGETQDSIVINPNNFRQIFWDITAEKVNPEAKLDISVKSKLGKSDSITTTIPTLSFGFADSDTKTGTGDQTYVLNIPSDTKLDESAVTVSLATNLLGTLPTAMRYLIDYPYGCVEQTTSRFVPAVIAKANLDLYYDAIESKDLDKIIAKGIERLTALQNSSGGWGWWSEGVSQLYITDYVLENLLLARNVGADVPDSLIDPAISYLTNLTPTNDVEAAYRIYGLSLVGTENLPKITNFNNLGPVSLAFAVLANSKSDTNPDSNGLTKLISLATQSGDSLYWPSDPNSSYPSVETSTALAMRAIIASGGDRDLAVKAARYLLSSRKQSYWANTHATALVVGSVTSLYKSGSESNPDYSYTVAVNGKNVATGKVASSTQLIKPITVPTSVLQSGDNKVVITKNGNGQVYSTVNGKYWRTDKNAAPTSNTISLTRKITNVKGADYTIGAGDTVNITLSVANLPPDSRYLVVEDNLPAGLVPVNTHLKNENTSGDSYRYYSNKEFTQTGVILSSYYNTGTFTYQARAITEGTFLTPPATAQLMYQPEVFARTSSETFKVDKVSQVSLAKQIENRIADPRTIFVDKRLLILTIVMAIAVAALLIYVFVKLTKRRPPKDEPPTGTTTTIPPSGGLPPITVIK